LVDRLVYGARVDLARGVAVDGTRNVFDESATVFSRARSSLLLSFRKRASASLGVGRSLRTTDESQGPGRRFRHDFAHRIGRGRAAEALRSASLASGFADRRSIGAIRPVFGRAWSAPAAVGESWR
jgi:hypothetical protein